MKRINIIKLSLLLGLIFLTAATGCTTANGGSYSSRSAATQGPAFDVASMLSGEYQLKDDNSDVRLKIGSTAGIGSAFDLLATASGTYEGRSLHQQGVIQLVSEGPDVRMSVIPHFTPVSELSPEANRFSETELRAACSLHLTADEQRWVGTTLGTGTCVQAVTGATGQWQVEILPGALRFTDVATKQALVFQKTGDVVSR